MSPPSIPLPNGHAPSPNASVPKPAGPCNPLNPSLQYPVPLRPLTRVDLHTIKQELHDVLGEDGLPYWKALNGYLLGQVARGEMEGLVRGWLKGKQIELHNKLVLALLHNASVPSHSMTPSSPLSLRKRKRLGPDDPEYDVDDTVIEPMARVHSWMLGLSGKDRARIKRAVMRQEQQGEEENVWGADKKKLGMQAVTMPSFAASGRLLPSAHQMSHRLSQLAKAYDLSVASDATEDIGEFLAVGMDAHLSDILFAVVHLTGRDRPGNNTVQVPPGTGALDGDNVKDEIPIEKALPKPDLETMRDLFTLNPGLNPSTSPALYKLLSNVTLAEKAYNTAPVKTERRSSVPDDIHAGVGVSTSSIKGERAEETAHRLVDAGLVRLDTAKEDKKDKKHSWHWKYEDPAVILESVLG